MFTRGFDKTANTACDRAKIRAIGNVKKPLKKLAVSEKLYAKAVSGALKGADRAKLQNVASRVGVGNANSMMRGKNKMAKKNLNIRDRVISRLSEMPK